MHGQCFSLNRLLFYVILSDQFIQSDWGIIDNIDGYIISSVNMRYSCIVNMAMQVIRTHIKPIPFLDWIMEQNNFTFIISHFCIWTAP